jgi:anthranilate phosphoribosyltransferase
VSALREAFDAVLAGRSLEAPDAERAFAAILEGGEGAPDPIVAGFLVALKIKGESAAELAGAARAMRARMRRVTLGAEGILDVVGTGGDGANSFNISTAAALVAAAAGVPVAKHGNRAASGRVGSADVLEHVGVRIDCEPDGLARCVGAAGICFIFAPAYHPVLVRLGPLRKALGIRTTFNLLGPLCNPASPERMLVGVGDPRLHRELAHALGALGVRHALVVCGSDGMDEITLAGPTRVAELHGEAPIREYEIAPEDFAMRRTVREAFEVRDAAHAAERMRSALGGGGGAAGDLVALNAGAAIYAGGRAASIREGIAVAREAIDSGAALATLERLVSASRGETR